VLAEDEAGLHGHVDHDAPDGQQGDVTPAKPRQHEGEGHPF